MEVLEVQCRVATLADSFVFALAISTDSTLCLSTRLQAELDAMRIAETYPEYMEKLPAALRERLTQPNQSCERP
jgi:hypothetical protein